MQEEFYTRGGFKGLLAIFDNLVFFYLKKTRFSKSKISGTTHGILKFFEDSESSSETPEGFFDLVDFDHGNLPNELREVSIFSVHVGVRLDSHQ